MFYINKNHVPPRCKIAKFSIVKLEIAHGSSHSMFCKGKGSGVGRGRVGAAADSRMDKLVCR